MSQSDSGNGMLMALCAIGGATVGWIARSRTLQLRSFKTFAVNNHVTDAHKMVIVVRKDLDMSAGKVAVQSAHAAVEAVAKAQTVHLDPWFAQGQPKIVVGCNKAATVDALRQQAVGLGLNAVVVRDAGRTQLEPGTATSVAIGPGPVKIVDKVTKHLKIF